MLSLIQSMHRNPMQTKAVDQPFFSHMAIAQFQAGALQRSQSPITAEVLAVTPRDYHAMSGYQREK